MKGLKGSVGETGTKGMEGDEGIFGTKGMKGFKGIPLMIAGENETDTATGINLIHMTTPPEKQGLKRSYFNSLYFI